MSSLLAAAALAAVLSLSAVSGSPDVPDVGGGSEWEVELFDGGLAPEGDGGAEDDAAFDAFLEEDFGEDEPAYERAREEDEPGEEVQP